MSAPLINPMSQALSRPLPMILIGAALLVSFLSLGQSDRIRDKPESLGDAGQAQLQTAARRLAEPGLYVASEVPYSRLNGAEFKSLKGAARAARVPTRIAVLPYSITRDGRLDARQLARELRRVVGEPGVYAVLVDNRGSGSLDATYWPGKSADSEAADRVDDAVAEAVTEANQCCARQYPAALKRFVDTAMDQGTPYRWLLWWLVPLLAVAALLVWRRWFRVGGWRTTAEPAPDDQIVTSMTPVLRDEVSELSFRVAALPAEEPDIATGTVKPSTRVTKAKRLLAAADGRTVKLASPRHRTLGDIVSAVRMIADLRYELHVIESLRLGKAKPARTPPCFIDPRHGPSERNREYAPTGKEVRLVPVCETCAGELDGGQRPAIRRLPQGQVGGSTGWANYWEADAAAAYVEGYWRDIRFPDEEFEESRIVPISPGKPDPVDILKLRLRTDRA
ncbi:MAG: hypothetical protein ACRCYU_03780 [Nocardioides sp.]